MNNIICTDLHCDLLSYLIEASDADPMIAGRIGCTIPDLQLGNVKLQVMAIYTATESGSVNLALRQALWFQKLINQYEQYFDYFSKNTHQSIQQSNKINIISAIENAAGICEEKDTINQAFFNLENIISICGKPLYIGLTHHGENRFGGGNSTKIGLKNDGKLLLDYMSKQHIAIDFSHTSDQLAHDILNYIIKNNIQLSIIASHSNFRNVYHHQRNLPDDIAKEIISRNGIIGINFLRAFLNPDNENAIYDHIQYGLELGAENHLCFGADYFYCDSHPDQTRKPFFFAAHENASKYPQLIDTIANRFGEQFAKKISSVNAINFIQKHYTI